MSALVHYVRTHPDKFSKLVSHEILPAIVYLFRCFAVCNIPAAVFLLSSLIPPSPELLILSSEVSVTVSLFASSKSFPWLCPFGVPGVHHVPDFVGSVRSCSSCTYDGNAINYFNSGRDVGTPTTAGTPQGGRRCIQTRWVHVIDRIPASVGIRLPI